MYVYNRLIINRSGLCSCFQKVKSGTEKTKNINIIIILDLRTDWIQLNRLITKKLIVLEWFRKTVSFDQQGCSHDMRSFKGLQV